LSTTADPRRAAYGRSASRSRNGLGTRKQLPRRGTRGQSGGPGPGNLRVRGGVRAGQSRVAPARPGPCDLPCRGKGGARARRESASARAMNGWGAVRPGYCGTGLTYSSLEGTRLPPFQRKRSGPPRGVFGSSRPDSLRRAGGNNEHPVPGTGPVVAPLSASGRPGTGREHCHQEGAARVCSRAGRRTAVRPGPWSIPEAGAVTGRHQDERPRGPIPGGALLPPRGSGGRLRAAGRKRRAADAVRPTGPCPRPLQNRRGFVAVSGGLPASGVQVESGRGGAAPGGSPGDSQGPRVTSLSGKGRPENGSLGMGLGSGAGSPRRAAAAPPFNLSSRFPSR